MKRIKQIGYCLLAGAISLTGCTSGEKKDIMPEAERAVKVKVQKLETASGSAAQSYIGTIEESVSVPLSFLIAGTVEKVLADEGQHVAKGQLLAVLNSESYQNAWQIALSKLKQAEDAYNRLEPVYQKGSLPEVKFVEIQTGLEQARSMAAISEKNVKDCKLYAPSSGTIGRRMIEPGMSIIPGNPVFQLVHIEKVNVKIPVPENEIAGIVKGLSAKIRVPALGNQEFDGKVTEVGVLSNPLSHTYMVKVELDNPEKLLKPGMVCNATIENPGLANRLVVPVAAVQSEANGQKYVYVAAQGKALRKDVETGALVSNGIVIKSGLADGDLLIVEGYQKLNNHSVIQINQ